MIQFDEHIFQMGWFNHQLEVRRVSNERFLFGPKVSLGKKSAEGTRWAKYDRYKWGERNETTP